LGGQYRVLLGGRYRVERWHDAVPSHQDDVGDDEESDEQW
jgi:hypothetical protein